MKAWARLTFLWLLGSGGLWALGCGDANTDKTGQSQSEVSTTIPPAGSQPVTQPVESPDDEITPGPNPVTPPTETPDEIPKPPAPVNTPDEIAQPPAPIVTPIELPKPPLPPPPIDTPNELPQQPPPPPPAPPPAPPIQGALRINEAQFKGTHNSYHVRPTVKTSPAWEYDMPTLTDQLTLYGVRAFEIDAHWDGARFPVYHWPDDPRSTCAYVTDCVAELQSWSSAHPQHAPLFVFIDLKYDASPDPIANHLDDLDAAIASQVPRNKIFTPDDFTGSLLDVHTAVVTRGWPTVETLRGKIIFALMSYDDVAKRYAHNDTNLHGRTLHIASGNTGLRYTSIAVFDVANSNYIRQAALGGFMVRTRADDIPTLGGDFPARFQAALASGANIIMTDYPVPYTVAGYDMTIPGGTPERCNPVTARASCISEAIENSAP